MCGHVSVCVCVCVCARARVLALSCGLLFVTPWTVACQAPLSMGFSRQECWSGLQCPFPEDLPNPGIKPASLMSPALAGGFFTTSATWEDCYRALKSWSGDSSQTRVTTEAEDSAIHRIIQLD